MANSEEPIDAWKFEPFHPGDMPKALLEESSFAVLFPAYREQYLREVWKEFESALAPYKLVAELDLREGSMTVRTTPETWDPSMILKARDIILLLARSVPLPVALRMLQDDMSCDIIKIKNAIRNRDRYIRRRERLIGPNGQTLRAIELLTDCYVLVQGGTVCVLGKHHGLKAVRRIVEDCFHNIHPAYHIKKLMVMRELAKNPEMAGEDWSRFLPKYEKVRRTRSEIRERAVKGAVARAEAKARKAARVAKVDATKTSELVAAARERAEKTAGRPKKKGAYTPFPPEQPMSKKDMEMASGEYFLKKEQRTKNLEEERRRIEEERSQAKRAAKQKDFVPKDRRDLAQASAPAPEAAPTAAPAEAAAPAGADDAAKAARRAAVLAKRRGAGFVQ